MFIIASKLNLTYDELIILNSMAIDISLKYFLVDLDFSIVVCADEDCKLILEGLKSKISSFSLEDWDALQFSLPCVVPFSIDDVFIEDGVVE